MRLAFAAILLLYVAACSDDPTRPADAVTPRFTIAPGSSATWTFQGQVSEFAGDVPAALGDTVRGSVTFTITSADTDPDPCAERLNAETVFEYTTNGLTYVRSGPGYAVTYTGCYGPYPLHRIALHFFGETEHWALDLNNVTDQVEFPLSPPPYVEEPYWFFTYDMSTGDRLQVLLTEVRAAPTEYSCAAQSEITNAECEALVALYESTNGPGWTHRDGWLETNSPCTWYGVQCWDGVTHLFLSDNQLSGTIPPELGNLYRLRYLVLKQNQLTDTIPEEIGNLAQLEYLALSTNRLTGPIPATFGDLASLRELRLDDNQLTGPLPAALGELSALTHLVLGYNQLGGTIPAWLADLSHLEVLTLDHDQLTGPIPADLGRLVSLRTLMLSQNELTGTIPAELGQLSDLQYLFLWQNQLTGIIPPELGNLSKLQMLLLHTNELRGLVPARLTEIAGKLETWACGLGLNPDLYLPDVPSYRAYDADNDGDICGLHFTADPAVVTGDVTAVVEDFLNAGVLNKGLASALLVKLAQASRLAGTGDYPGAVQVLKDFIQQVEELVVPDHVFTAAQGQALTERAAVLMQFLR